MTQDSPDISKRQFVAFILLVLVEASAAVVVVLEVLTYARIDTSPADLNVLDLLINRGFDFAIIVVILLFEFFLGREGWKYLHSKNTPAK